MSWINTLNLWQWLVFGAIPPLIVLLYFLKLRRTAVIVPSTYLWKKTIEDMHVNSIWQRLRQNLLLLLQLLVVAGLILACLRPGCQGDELIGERFIFVIDQSASMSALDTDSGKSRLEEAKEQALTMVERMENDAAAMVISFSNQALVQQSYTKNRALLKRKIKEIAQTDRASDLSEALQAAAGLANPGRTSDRESNIDVQVAEALAATMVIFSDGGVNDIPGFSLGNLTPEYRPIGSQVNPANVGIAAFSINDQLEVGEQVQVFARLFNSGSADAEIDLELFVNKQLRDAKGNVVVPAKGFVSINFDLSDLIAGLAEPTPVELVIENKDVYQFDNRATCVLNPPRVAKVLVLTDYNPYLKLVADTDRIAKLAEIQWEQRSYIQDKEYQQRSMLSYYDLIIFDQCVPQQLPTSNSLFWGSLPPGEDWTAVKELAASPIVDFNREHPLMNAVGMNDLLIASSQSLTGPQGSVSLLETISGSIMVIGPRGGYEDLVIGFPLVKYLENGETTVNSDWPRKLSFPIFFQNLMVYLAGGEKFSATRTFSPGEIMTLKPTSAEQQLTITDPFNQATELTPRNDGLVAFAKTDKVGLYSLRVANQSEVDQLFAVNLLDVRESDLEVRQEINLGFNKIEGQRQVKQARIDYWPWIVIGVLVILLIEWYIFNRRVFI